MEVDAIEQAIEENKTVNQGSWMDLFNQTYLRRTIVSFSDQFHVYGTMLIRQQIVSLLFFFNQVTGQQFANSYGPS
jgi:hypothetical protein